jgi:hypothetical protein
MKRYNEMQNKVPICSSFREDTEQCIIGCPSIKVELNNVCPYDYIATMPNEPLQDVCPCYTQ